MINNAVGNCAICENEFYAEKLKDGKCDVCNSRFPGIKNKAELEKQREEDNSEFNKGSLPSLIKEKVESMLEEYGILQKCECGNLFYKRSPAQKGCGKCKTENN